LIVANNVMKTKVQNMLGHAVTQADHSVSNINFTGSATATTPADDAAD